MAKHPVMGAVKTRLARDVGGSEAIRFYRNCLRTVVARLSSDPRWSTALAIDPGSALTSPVWPPRIARLAQGRGDLGVRMQRLLETPTAMSVVVVGTDVPGIRCEHIARAFRLLGGHAAVFGPAEDGGFWLAGLRKCPRALRPFRGVRWSSPQTLDATLANLAGARFSRADMLSDVDMGADLRRLGGAAARLVPACGG